jgi:hypothetical protein
MVFSRLLLAADSKNYISGAKKEDKVCVQTETGEFALCFQIDDDKKQIPSLLDLNNNDKRCDGLIFFAKDGEDNKVICLVEMKSTHINTAAEQIKATKLHIEGMLRHECGSHYNKLLSRITWKACFYSYGSSDDRQKRTMINDLKMSGFKDVKDVDRSKNNVTDFLRGNLNAKNLAKKLRNKR